jgi:predicted kinase
MMSKLILPMGISGSGKSTWIKTLPYVTVLSADEMRVIETGNIDNKSKDAYIYHTIINMAIELLKSGKHVVIDATNLQRERRRNMVDVIMQSVEGTEVWYKFIHCPLETAIERVVNRTGGANVSTASIERQYNLYQLALEDVVDEPMMPW